MSHGEAIRPIETTDAKPVDRSNSLGNSSLHVIDNRSEELLTLILEEMKKQTVLLEALMENF